MSTATIPHRGIKQPRPCCIVVDVRQAAALVLHQIRRLRADSGAGAWLFIDKELRCYVLSDESSCALEWQRDRWPDLVGFYRLQPQKPDRFIRGETPWLFPTVNGLVDDIAGHLATLAR